MKEIGLEHWLAPNTDANNTTGFTALPAGRRSYDYGNSYGIGTYGTFWSSTISSYSAGTIELNRAGGSVFIWNKPHTVGYSVRCIKD